MEGLPSVTVCGCGNAGMAIAADVSLLGCEVNVFEMPDFKANLGPIVENHGITLTGKTISGKTGLAKVNRVTSDPKEAVEGVDVIMIAVPAQAHGTVIEAIVPYLEEGQTILVNTGYWASLRFNELLKSKGLLNKVTIVESNIMPYLSGRVGPAHVNIFNYKKSMKVSTWPATKNEEAYNLVKKIYPQFSLSKNVIENNFYPGNASVHAQITIPKAEFLFERAREFRFYAEVTKSAAKLADAFDKERIKLTEAYDCETTDYVSWHKETYGYEGKDLYELHLNTEHGKRWGRVDGIYRVLIEDLCYVFIPMEQFAKIAGIELPLTTAMIEILQVFTGIDFRSQGITLKDLGLEGLTKKEIIDYVTYGEK